MTKAHKNLHPGLSPVNDTQLTRESWKIFQIMAEFVEGFERLVKISPSVSIFGSARTKPDSLITNSRLILRARFPMPAFLL